VSKSSRRRRPTGTPPANRPTGGPPPSPSGTSAAGSAASASRPPASNPAASSAAGSTWASAAATAGTRPTGSAVRPSSSSSGRPRAGRRERQRVAYQRSFVERHRAALLVGAAVVGIALISAFVLFQATQPAFACSTIWTPSPTASPGPGQTPNLGYPQPDMGHNHVNPGDKVTYTYCAPASGNHINRPGTAGPIPARVYGPGDNVIPQNWIHNLEHGGLVVLYRGDSAGATPDGQAAFKSWQAAFPPVQDCGPVVARFDQMSTPFQALVWGRVLMMDSWDPNLVQQYWLQWGGRTNGEQLCPTPNSPSASPAGSAAPSESLAPTGSPVPSPSDSTAPSAAPSAVPSAAPSAS
jgi:uncharacterized protein DUF3105